MKKYLLFLCYWGISLLCHAQQIKVGAWEISLDPSSKLITIKNQGNTILKDVYASADCGFESDSKLTTRKSIDAMSANLTSEDVSDELGTGKRYTFTYRFANAILMNQSFAFYEGQDLFVTQLSLSTELGTSKLKSNHLVPLSTSTEQQIISSTSSRMLWVPWDNDGFVEYRSNNLNTEEYSYNATAIYEPSSRYGLVMGAIDHDTWKSAIHVNAKSKNKVSALELISGYTDSYSRDQGVVSLVNPSDYTEDKSAVIAMPHGTVKGTSVSSSRFVFGCFSDWRIGMETYGKECAKVAPARTWDGGTPYGWSSWGGMETKVSYEGVMDVAKFLSDKVRVHGFHDEKGRIVLSLDAWWNDNLSQDQLKKFVAYCKENNMIPGLYYGPFTDWSGDPNRTVTNTNYKLKDMWLKQDGKYRKLDGAYCLDPTHPGTRAEITNQMNYFKSLGIEYVKLDFMCNGAIEADSYYNKNITTGIQAYNFGMKVVRKQATYADGHSMYLVLSIAPLFPSQYTHGRRISCDAWGTIGNTRYVMNSTSYGWWLREVYFANDPDNMVLVSKKGNGDGKESEGENRARITNGAITGAFLVGDNFSDQVVMELGNPSKSRERAEKFLTIEDINEIPRTCKTFRPVYGNGSQSKNAENYMTYENDKYVYLACINYNSILSYLNGNVSFKDLDIDESNVGEIKELWSGNIVSPTNGGISIKLAPADACIYRITKKNTGTGISDVSISQDADIRICKAGNGVAVSCHDGQLLAIHAYDLSGKEVAREKVSKPSSIAQLTIPYSGIYLLKMETSLGTKIKKIAL